MKIVGLITEYNPFHNGHKYHIEQSKKLTGADAVIVVMSGNYVQRGLPAFMPKHLRAEMALRHGASLVLELPVYYATGSAELFAMGAVSLLEKLGCVDAICFGSECGELTDLEITAKVLVEEPREYQLLLQRNLRLGMSFPTARVTALRKYWKHLGVTTEDVLRSPNNILGIEYLKALYTLNSPITPYTINRIESQYHDKTLQPNYSSASAIRNCLSAPHTNNLNILKNQIPSTSFKLLETYRNLRYPIDINDFSFVLKCKLLSETKTSLHEYADVSEELANKIIKYLNSYKNFEQFCQLLKTKDIAYSRISRGLLHILLGIKKCDLENYCQKGFHFYAHILGFRKDKLELLSIIKKYSSIPLLSKLTHMNSLSTEGKDMLNTDIYCSNIYESMITEKYNTLFIHECEHSILRI